MAALAFEDAILKDLETGSSTAQIGDGSILGNRLHSEIIKQRCSLNVNVVLYGVKNVGLLFQMIKYWKMHRKSQRRSPVVDPQWFKKKK